MIQALVLIETVAVALLTFWLVRRAPSHPASRGRLAGIVALLVAQAIILDGFTLRVLPSLWGAGREGVPGLLWLVQAGRASLLIAAFALWYGISREELGRGHHAMLAVALLAVGGSSVPVLGVAALLWLSGRPAWTREFSGWRRAIALVVGPLLLTLTTWWPQAVFGEGGGIEHQWVVFTDPWQAPLVSGATHGRLEVELALVRPLDRLVQGLLDLFRGLMVVLTLRALTMPMRLYGMTLRRRFMVNYLFVRSIPSVLATLTLVLVGYVAFGVHQAGLAREAFERTLARADAASGALLDDPRIARGGLAAVAELDSARRWLGPVGARAHLALRQWEGPRGGDVWLAATPGIPTALAGVTWPGARVGVARGVIVADSALYLFARRTEASDSTRTLEVFVRLDSASVAEVARAIGARLTLSVDRGYSGYGSRLPLLDDARGRSTIVVASHGSVAAGERRLFLGRTYVPLGAWGAGWVRARGAMVLEIHTTPGMLGRSLAYVPAWLFSNVGMVLLLVLLTSLFGIIEGLAVRSGRGVVRSIEEEVGALREAATRFGAGELGHRIPVRGRDELSELAGSFNEMAASLERQRAELVEKERLDEDLEVALAIQRRFLPQRSPTVPGLEVSGVSVPSREVGGDLFHYLELPGGRLAVALGDVSGKSVPAALIMSNVMSALRAEVQHEAEVEKSLERINRLLVEQVEPGRFVTLFYGIADPTMGRLRYASAGHNPVLRVTAGGEVGWLKEGGVPLGVQPEARYPSAEFPLEPGDVVVAYSDGVTEAEGPERDGRISHFGEQRLAECVSGLRTQPAETIVQGVLAAVKAFAGPRPQADDITLVVIRRVGGATV